MPSNEQLYDSFLPYRTALALARWCRGLLHIQTHLQNQTPIPECLGDACGSVARSLHPELRPPSYTPEEFVKMREQENRVEKMTPEEKEEYLEELSEDLHQKIENGEINLWEGKKRYISPQEAGRFLEESRIWLLQKIQPACNPNASLLEDLVLECLQILQTPPIPKDTAKGLRRILYLWEEGKIRHEGEPPYKIVFAPQVAEFLGVDAELESIQLQCLPPLKNKDKKLLRSVAQTSKKLLPHRRASVDGLCKFL